jgi:hypothetical protein
MALDERAGILMGTTWTERGLILQASVRQFRRVKGRSEASLDVVERVNTIETRFCVARLVTKTVPKQLSNAYPPSPPNPRDTAKVLL